MYVRARTDATQLIATSLESASAGTIIRISLSLSIYIYVSFNHIEIDNHRNSNSNNTDTTHRSGLESASAGACVSIERTTFGCGPWTLFISSLFVHAISLTGKLIGVGSGRAYSGQWTASNNSSTACSKQVEDALLETRRQNQRYINMTGVPKCTSCQKTLVTPLVLTPLVLSPLVLTPFVPCYSENRSDPSSIDPICPLLTPARAARCQAEPRAPCCSVWVINGFLFSKRGGYLGESANEMRNL